MRSRCVQLIAGLMLCSTSLFAAVTVSISPTSATVVTGGDRRFTATVAGATNKSVKWSVNGVAGGNTTVGTIDSAGLYRAPSKVPVSNLVKVKATSVAATSKSATAAVTIVLPTASPVVTTVSPSSFNTGNFSLTVNGSGFVTTSKVRWNGQALATTYVSGVKLTATGNAASAGTFAITVANPAPAPVSNSVNVTVTSPSPGPGPAPAPDPAAVKNGRFLDQVTFGQSPASMTRVKQLGLDAYLAEQLAMPESPLPPITVSRGEIIDVWFANQLSGNDQLRQRVIYALSGVVVVSMNKNVNGDMVVPYLQILSRNALGNYRTLLGEITLDASMGMFLDMVNSTNNVKSGANENYPRELMQLFTIGIYKLNPDGSTKVDGMGTPIPAYTQTDVRELARAFTGWTYDNSSHTSTASSMRGAYYPGTMVPAPSYHDAGAKAFLGAPIPAFQSPKQDVDSALDILFNHPNIGPFLATRLIRALVTSNPSPGYITRVAATFDDDGTGVRGNLSAVVKAVIMDAEARNDSPPSGFGRLRTPVQETIAMVRALGLPMSAASQVNYLFAGMGESILAPPSVFGHYSPMFRIPKTALFGPEFQIYTATEAVNRANFFYSMWFGSGGTLHPTLQPFQALAGDHTALVNAVDSALLYGRMPSATRNAILQALPPMYDAQQKVMTALYLTVNSADFLVQH